MQSAQNGNADKGDKNLAEWPTLGDVCSNVKVPHQNGNATKSSRLESKRDDSPAGSDDSTKENDYSSHPVTSGVRRKGSRQKWVPIPIVPIPYRKRYERGNGRQAYESHRGAVSENDCDNFERKSENGDSFTGTDNRRGNGRFRGKRGRGFSHSWKRREESSRGEIEPSTEPVATDAQSGLYYDPYLQSHYAAMTRKNDLKKAIRTQIEYYFSDENLVKDFFMRRRMDTMGYVPLTLVAGFRRVKSLTTDFAIIVESVNESDKLDVLQNEKLRPVVDPLKWPLQDYGLRPDVPDFIPGQPYFSISSLVECMQNCDFFSADGVYPEDVCDVEVPDIPFDEVMHAGFAVSAT